MKHRDYETLSLFSDIGGINLIFVLASRVVLFVPIGGADRTPASDPRESFHQEVR